MKAFISVLSSLSPPVLICFMWIEHLEASYGLNDNHSEFKFINKESFSSLSSYFHDSILTCVVIYYKN